MHDSEIHEHMLGKKKPISVTWNKIELRSNVYLRVFLKSNDQHCRIFPLKRVSNAGCAAGNVSTESNLQARLGFHPVEFKCHYTLGPHETVHARNISWQIESVTGSGQFETIAEFSLPNAPRQSNQYVTTSVGTDFKTRSALLNVVSSGSNSYTAVFRLIEVRCEDEGNFRCSVVFSSTSGSTTVSSDVSLFLTGNVFHYRTTEVHVSLRIYYELLYLMEFNFRHGILI